MTDTLSKHERNLSAFIHASVFSRYFLPLGNIILPLILWSINKKDYKFVDYNGKQVLNFQISLLLYALVLGVLSIPFLFGAFPNVFEVDHILFNSFKGFHWNINGDNFNFRNKFIPFGIAVIAQGGLVILNIIYTILGTLRTNEGQTFKYPISINFIK
ncbi:DUF4870 domain-containing protein [Sediminicola arcticus]|jgi:uncharacterized Tic20 family protein|uniref:DUF4870 domain-containing protein n=1 Tax=Sediminicola arcticus TaxID=1574308 RepID=A0ABV2SX33_9FLAO